MKKTKIFLLLAAALFAISCTVTAQEPGVDSTGLPGDHFSLRGALDMFKKAASPEAFEKLINTQDNDVNNIDLDGDGDVDYVKVIDKSGENAHAFVLQVAVSETENQDIAVIELEQTGDTTAVLQIVGDEDIYGEQLIVEASDGTEEVIEEANNNGNGRGPSGSFDAAPGFIVINVWRWPSVRFVYAPAYRPWLSPWRWRHHPGWFRPWHPVRWGLFRPRCNRYYHPGFRVVRTHRVMVARRVYTPYRRTSAVVRTRNAGNVNNYRVTRTTRRTNVTGPRGNEYKVKQTTWKVKDEDGDVRGKKTKTTVRRKRG
jgi:hypothetical protein